MGGQLRAVFSLVAIILVICVTITLTSFRELPLALLETKQVIIHIHCKVSL